MLDMNKIDLRIKITDTNKMTLECLDAEQNPYRYAYYIYKDDEIIAKFSYTENNKINYWLSESGVYSVRVFISDPQTEEKKSKNSEKLVFDADLAFGVLEEGKEKNVFENFKEVINELIKNRAIIFRVAKFDYQLQNKDTYLGKLWSFITPFIQIGTYWLVFGIGLRQGKDVNGYTYLVWMLVGLVPWFYISSAILQGANSIYTKSNIVTKMKFPVSTIPVSKIIQEFYEFLMLMIIMFIVLLFSGVMPRIHWFNLIYYIVYCVAFLISLSMVTSVLTMLARDIYKLLNSLIRLLFYVTPILWVMDNMPILYQRIMNFNPIFYIVQGFRESILYNTSFYQHWKMVLFMWGLNAILFSIGCLLQAKFKNKFIDLL